MQGLTGPIRTASITASIWRLCGISVGAILVLVVALLWTMERISGARMEAARTIAIESILRHLGEDLLDAETGQRGFILTQDEHYLDPFRSGIDNAHRDIDLLRRQTLNPVSQDDLDRIVPVVAAKLEELEKTVALTRSGRRDAAMGVIAEGRGLRLMNEFRAIRSQAIDREMTQLDARRERISRTSFDAVATLIVGSLGVLLLLIGNTRHLTRKLSQAIKAVMDGMEAVTSGSLESRLPIAAGGELGRIASAFNAMTDRLVEARDVTGRALRDLERSHGELRSREEAARTNQSFLARTGATAGVGGWELNLVSGTVTWSDETCRLLGLAPGYRPRTREAIRYFAPDAKRLVRTSIRSALTHGSSWDLEVEMISAKGRSFWARVNGAIERENGKIIRLIGACQDVTEKISAQRQLRQQTENLQATLDNMQHGIVKMASDRRIELANHRFAELLDIPTQVMGQRSLHFDEVLAYLDDDGNAPSGTGSAARRRPVDRSEPIAVGTQERVRANGQILEIVTSPLADGSVVSTYSDITARRRAEKAVRDSEARYRMLADATSDIITQLDLDLVRRYVSPACRAMLGYEPEEMLGIRPAATIHPDDAAAVTNVMKRLIAGTVPGDKATTTNRMRHKQGHWVWLEAGMNLVRDPDTGAPTSMICVLRDVTERQRAARHLERARTMAETTARNRADFLANMSHELRTPLTGILGIVDRLRDDPALGGEQRRYLSLAQDAGRSLLTIVNDILDFSKIEAGQLSIEALPFDPAAVIQSCIAFGCETAKAKSLAVTSTIGIGPKTLRGDANRLRQIVLNLLSNAIKFTERGSVGVTAVYDAARGRLRIEVADSGIGIEDDKLPLLFGRFSQADASITRRYGGTGLGLAISKRLVDLMEGRIGASSALGRGSTFWFDLPLPVVVDDAAAAPPPPVNPAIPRRVLLAEDNAINLDIISAMIGQRGHAVTAVADGMAAVAAAQKGQYDIILLDLQMPQMDGLSATLAIRTAEASGHRERTPIIGLTANAMLDDIRRCREVGMDAHVAKPIHWSELFATMDRLVLVPRGTEFVEPVDRVVLDDSVLAELQASIGPERVARAVGQFLAEIAGRATSLVTAGESQRTREAHALRSLAGQLGFLELARLCATIEDQSPEGGLAARLDCVQGAAERAVAAAQASGYRAS